MNKNNINTSSGVTFTSILFLRFLALTLTHVIDWSWWWITAPIWGPFAIVVVVLIIIAVIAVLLNKK